MRITISPAWWRWLWFVGIYVAGLVVSSIFASGPYALSSRAERVRGFPSLPRGLEHRTPLSLLFDFAVVQALSLGISLGTPSAN